MPAPVTKEPMKWADVCKGKVKGPAAQSKPTNQWNGRQSAMAAAKVAPAQPQVSKKAEGKRKTEEAPPPAPAPALAVEDEWDWNNPQVQDERAAFEAWCAIPPPPEGEPKTLEELMQRQAHMHDYLVTDLVPFWLKAMEAAERGEELKLEAFFDAIVAERKAAGWYWTPSDYDRAQPAKKDGKLKDADGWSHHKASENGGRDMDQDGWDNVASWQKDIGPTWGDMVQDSSRPVEQPTQDGWDIVASKKKMNNTGSGWINSDRPQGNSPNDANPNRTRRNPNRRGRGRGNPGGRR